MNSKADSYAGLTLPEWSHLRTTVPKSWQFRFKPWTSSYPLTLADVPDNSPSIVVDAAGNWIFAYRVGNQAFNQCVCGLVGGDHECGGEYCGHPNSLIFVRYLDPRPATQPTLDDVPDGRVIYGTTEWWWRDCGEWWVLRPDGSVSPSSRKVFTKFTATDYIAEFK